MFSKEDLEILRHIHLSESFFDSNAGIKAAQQGAEKALKQANKNYK